MFTFISRNCQRQALTIACTSAQVAHAPAQCSSSSHPGASCAMQLPGAVATGAAVSVGIGFMQICKCSHGRLTHTDATVTLPLKPWHSQPHMCCVHNRLAEWKVCCIVLESIEADHSYRQKTTSKCTHV